MTIDEIKLLRSKITPGPWAYMTDEPFSGEIRSCGESPDDPTAFSHIADAPEGDDRPDDFAFIAAVPEIVDTLLARIEELEQRVMSIMDWGNKMKSRQQMIDEYSKAIESAETMERALGYSLGALFEVLLDIRDQNAELQEMLKDDRTRIHVASHPS